MSLRNIAIIAHVDHGKTTLIDSIFRQSGTFRENQEIADRIMDSNALEKERGITILAKCTAVEWKGVKINVVDTPGHADFGAEVERILSMVDGVLLLVDSSEGVMPQTKFVLGKALKQGLNPIVIINKIDRPDKRISEVENEVFDLFVSLGANDKQLDFPILYAVGREGWAIANLADKGENLHPLMDKIVEHVHEPVCDKNAPFSFLATILESDPFVGRILTGKIYTGKVSVGTQVKAINLNGEIVDKGKITRVQSFLGMSRTTVDESSAGDIVTIAGLSKATISDTICAVEIETPIKTTPIDPPTMSVTIGVNTSPLSGQEGAKVTSSLIRERLAREEEVNVSIKFTESDKKDAFEVSGRGELQLGILIENMRREGFELSVSRPKVLIKKDDHGHWLEPFEEVVIDVDEQYSGTVIDKINCRKGEMKDMKQMDGGKTRLIYIVPTRGLVGYQSEFLSDTRGTGVMNRIFHAYDKYLGPIDSQRKNGALISIGQGEAVAYAIWNLEDRGIMFIKPQDKVYNGMIVGEHNRDNDLCVNILKGKQLTNVRASGTDEAVKLTPHKEMTLEQMISYIKDDELIEVTPKSLRLRKEILDESERKRSGRKG